MDLTKKGRYNLYATITNREPNQDEYVFCDDGTSKYPLWQGESKIVEFAVFVDTFGEWVAFDDNDPGTLWYSPDVLPGVEPDFIVGYSPSPGNVDCKTRIDQGPFGTIPWLRLDVGLSSNSRWKKIWRWVKPWDHSQLSDCPATRRQFNYEITLVGEARVRGNAYNTGVFSTSEAQSTAVATATVSVRGDNPIQDGATFMDISAEGGCVNTGGFNWKISTTGAELGRNSGAEMYYDSFTVMHTKIMTGAVTGVGGTKEVYCAVYMYGTSMSEVWNYAREAESQAKISAPVLKFE